MAYSQPQRYRAPNGGAVFLPPEVAAGFVGLEPDLPPAPPEPDPAVAALVSAPTIPVPPPGAVPDAGLMPPLAPSTAPMPEPPQVQPAPALAPAPDDALMQPATAPTTSGPTVAPALAPMIPGAPASQARQPLTPDDVRAGGYAPVLEQQQEALSLKRAAGREQIALDTASAQAEGRALAASGERDVQREAERARIQQETMADIARRSAAIDTEIDRIANTKIDASIRRPALSAIAIAMGAIGAAMAGKNDGSNPALDMILKQRDANVQRQLAEKDAAVRTVGLRRDQLAGIRQRLTDTNALYDGLAAAETRRIRTELARVAASTKSEAGKANLLKLDADLAAEEAGLLASTKDKQFALDDREKQRREQERANRVGEQQRWAGIAQADRHHQDNIRLKREENQKDLEVALARASGDKAKALVEASAKAKTLGLVNPFTGDPLVTADGQKLLDAAADLDKRAEALRAAPSPLGKSEAEKFATRAAELRAEARSLHAAMGRRPEHAEALQQKLSTTQTTLSLIDEIKADARKAGKQVLNANELESRLGTKLDLLSLNLNKAYGLGALDTDTRSLLERITGGDPSKLDRRGVLGMLGVGQESGEKTVTKLDAVAKSLESSAQNDLRSVQVKNFRFKRDDEAESPAAKASERILDDKTSIEEAASESSPALLKAGETLIKPFGESLEARRVRLAENAPALSKAQEDEVRGLITAAKRGDGDARKALIKQATHERASLGNAVLNVIKGESPEIYAQAVAALPDEQRQLRVGLAKIGREGESLFDLERRAASGMPDAQQELQRRAEADRGGAAAQSWMRVLGELDRQRRAAGLR